MARLPTDVETEIDRFCNDIKRNTYTRSADLALATIFMFKKLIGESKWSNASELITLIRSQAHRLNQGQPVDSITFNITRRILKLIRDVSARIIHGKNEGSDISLTLQAVLNDRAATSTFNDDDNENIEENLQPKTQQIQRNLTDSTPISNAEGEVSVQRLKPELMDDLNWYSSDIELSVKNLSQQALAHIHANELILTLGYSYTVEQFFKYAASKNRKFHVFILEHAPFFTGHKMAVNLSALNIPVTVVTDSAVFAIMARVNKILIGTRSLLANGGLTAKSGTYNLALAAKHYNVPLLVCAPTYKFSPTYLPSFDPVMCNTFPSPETILSYESIYQSSLDIVVPMHDYVPPELVTLIIGSGMGNAPSYVYRIVSELYSAEDNDLERLQKESLK
ncbi:unnamed protein product [Rotaria socialis]|uniref:Translation initiation factor eIF2B subunit beta n=1 Tax=Rotaria socialis TaxID=392032 RepID=A0A818A070_9BILA|nr:unnamed protein product [Rotaria socialis]CAF3514772.1 unnamed protein product [Rotaria socialis]CAF3642710.1 unnamed protein product [Rotaria socialis]CAF3684139.1 unnamed protein product [Rotaria socialis]CAF3794939.1 unnamed protein product [Rotaria socialis]